MAFVGFPSTAVPRSGSAPRAARPIREPRSPLTASRPKLNRRPRPSTRRHNCRSGLLGKCDASCTSRALVRVAGPCAIGHHALVAESGLGAGETARSTYQVRVRDPDTAERVGDQVRTVLRELPFFGPFSPHFVKVTIEIVNVRTGAVVADDERGATDRGRCRGAAQHRPRSTERRNVRGRMGIYSARLPIVRPRVAVWLLAV